MTRPAADAAVAIAPAIDAAPAGDYHHVRRTLRFVAEHWQSQPQLDDIARHLGLSPAHCQRVFKRWCGVSPKEFLQAVTLDHARRLLDGEASVLAAAHEVGLSGGGRLHDLFVTHEAMSPGESRRRGEGLELAYGAHATPFGSAVAAMSPRGLAALAFVDEDKGQTVAEVCDELRARWPRATWVERPEASAGTVARIFGGEDGAGRREVRIVLIGTDWEVRVWRALLEIPFGGATSYTGIARRVCTERAARAVGAAVGKNPISFVVPCHRVLRADGGLGGYHWGLTRKQAMIGWEAAQLRGGRDR